MSATLRWLTLDFAAQRSNIPSMDLSTIEPDRRYSYAEIAVLTGLEVSTLRSYVVRKLMPKPGYWDAPDRPRWSGQQLIDWQNNRPGQGAPGRPKRRWSR